MPQRPTDFGFDGCRSDAYIQAPVRELDKPFIMAVEDVFSISGRGTVATGRYRAWTC